MEATVISATQSSFRSSQPWFVPRRGTSVSQIDAKAFVVSYRQRYPKVFAFLELHERLASGRFQLGFAVGNEAGFAGTADRALPIIRNRLEGGACGDAGIRIPLGRVVNH